MNIINQTCKDCSRLLKKDKNDSMMIFEHIILGDKILEQTTEPFNCGGLEEYLKKYFPKAYEIDIKFWSKITI
jgi:hypothetical protein